MQHYRVNRQGEHIRWTDRSGTVHEYGYDLLGRPTSDTVTTLGSGVDGAIRAITTGYDDAGRVHLVSSLDGSSNLVHQIERLYNGLGQLVAECQEHAGEVDGNTPFVGYIYSEMTGGRTGSKGG